MNGYERYQLQCMIDTGFSLGDLMQELTDFQSKGNGTDAKPISEIFTAWEEDVRDAGGIWPTEDEWFKNGKSQDMSKSFIKAYCWLHIAIRKLALKMYLWRRIIGGDSVALYTVQHWDEFLNSYYMCYRENCKPLDCIRKYTIRKEYDSWQWRGYVQERL